MYELQESARKSHFKTKAMDVRERAIMTPNILSTPEVLRGKLIEAHHARCSGPNTPATSNKCNTAKTTQTWSLMVRT